MENCDIDEGLFYNNIRTKLTNILEGSMGAVRHFFERQYTRKLCTTKAVPRSLKGSHTSAEKLNTTRAFRGIRGI